MDQRWGGDLFAPLAMLECEREIVDSVNDGRVDSIWRVLGLLDAHLLEVLEHAEEDVDEHREGRG